MEEDIVTNGIVFILLVDALIRFLIENEENGFNPGEIINS